MSMSKQSKRKRRQALYMAGAAVAGAAAGFGTSEYLQSVEDKKEENQERIAELGMALLGAEKAAEPVAVIPFYQQKNFLYLALAAVGAYFIFKG